MKSQITQDLRRLLLPWSFALLLPMPMLMVMADAANSDIATLYLALGAAWLAAEAFQPAHAPRTRAQWRTRLAALVIYQSLSGLLFTVLGYMVGVQSNIPLPVLAGLGLAPALGLVPWLTLRFRQPYAAIVLAGIAMLALKLAACVVARVVYGPDYIALGYVSADWQTAKLMISLTWTGALLLSVGALIHCDRKLWPLRDQV